MNKLDSTEVQNPRRYIVVDSMRESIHALRCDFLCLQDTQRKLIDGLGYFMVVSR